MSGNGATNRHDWTGESFAVQEHSARVRAKAILTRIQMLDTFVATAELQLSLNESDQARSSLEKIRHAVSEIEFHLREPRHVPPRAVGELLGFLEKIKPKISKLEKAVNDSDG